MKCGHKSIRTIFLCDSSAGSGDSYSINSSSEDGEVKVATLGIDWGKLVMSTPLMTVREGKKRRRIETCLLQVCFLPEM